MAKGRRAHLYRSLSSTLAEDVRCYNSGSQIVAMMQAAEPGHGYDLAVHARIARCFATAAPRLDEDQCPVPSRPELPQDYPEQFVRRGQSWLRMPLLQNGELLLKSEILQEQFATRATGSKCQDEQQLQRTEHKNSLTWGTDQKRAAQLSDKLPSGASRNGCKWCSGVLR